MIESVSELKKISRKKYLTSRSKIIAEVEGEILKQTIKVLKERITRSQLNGYIGIYWPLKGEVDLRSLKDFIQLDYALPSCSKEGRINYFKWSNYPLKKDAKGIPSSIMERKLKAEDLSLLLVPAVAIDSNGYRLGYGGGYFDKLRSKNKWRAIPSLVIVPSICVSSNPLPREAWDIPFQGWITEKGETTISEK